MGSIFKRAHVRGISFELTRQGLLGWPSEKIAEEVADAVADNLEPEELAEVTPEDGLTADEASNVIEQLVDVAKEIAEKTSGAVDTNFNKLAASVDPREAASLHAVSLMEKAAEEATGTDVTGDGRFQDEIMGGGMGDIDAEKTPSSDLVAPIGTSSLDTSSGAVGAEKPQDEPPGATALTQGEVAKISQLLYKLSQGEGDLGTVPGSGDSGSVAYTEPNTNMGLSGAITQGTTAQPAGPVIGDQMPQPALESPVTTSGEVAKLSSLLSRALKKLSEDEDKSEEEEDMKEEEKEEEDTDDTQLAEGDKEEEAKKEASDLLSALRTVARYIPVK